MAATDHTRLRTAEPSADGGNSTDTGRGFPFGTEAPPGASPMGDRGIAAGGTPHGSTDTQPIDCAAHLAAEPIREAQADTTLDRARLGRQVETVCDYLELGVALATVAGRTVRTSPHAADQSLARTLADLAERIETEITYLRRATGIERVPSAGRRGAVNRAHDSAGTVSQ